MSIRLQPFDLSANGWQRTTFTQNKEESGAFKEANLLATPLERLTDGAINGTGVFDKLMASVKEHLQEEFQNERITGPDYANVYVGVMAAVLQTSAAFLLNEQQAHVFSAQIGKIRQETVTELAQTDDNIPEGLGFNFRPDQKMTIPPLS